MYKSNPVGLNKSLKLKNNQCDTIHSVINLLLFHCQ